MSPPPVPRVLVTCGDAATTRWARAPGLADEHVVLDTVPARTEIDPLLDRADGLVVAGTDAAMAAVLLRLLRRDRLDLPLALLPDPDSAAATAWSLPTDPAAAVALAREGTARDAPLIRDDRGGVVLGRHALGTFHGSVYCDEHLVSHGDAAGLIVRPDPLGGVAVEVTGPRRLGGLRPGSMATRTGRAVQVGCRPAAAIRDGVPDDRSVRRRSWYRHTEDWRLVRP